MSYSYDVTSISQMMETLVIGFSFGVEAIQLTVVIWALGVYLLHNQHYEEICTTSGPLKLQKPFEDSRLNSERTENIPGKMKYIFAW